MAGMYVKYGDYQFASGEASVAVSVKTIPNGRNAPYKKLVQFDIMGEFCSEDQDEVTTQLAAMEVAFSTHYQDIGLYHDDGSPTVHIMLDSHPTNCTGNQVKYANYPQTQNGEYVTGRMFTIGVAAEILDTSQYYVNFRDNIVWQGNGGAKWIWKHDRFRGFYPEKIANNSMQCVRHYGWAIGSIYYPPVPVPLYLPPFEDNTLRQVQYSGPQSNPKFDTDWSATWQYTYNLPGFDDSLRPVRV